MKNLPQTIDRIIKLDPDLEQQLVPIRDKAKRYPKRIMDYWKELLNVLNSEPLQRHPQRERIKHIVSYTPKTPRKLYSFEDLSKNDFLIGVIPENIADKMRRFDRNTIEVNKLSVEASMTKDTALMAQIARRQAKMEIDIKRVWFFIKDYFKLWDVQSAFTVKKHDGCLVLVRVPNQSNTGPGIIPMGMRGGIMRMDPDMMKDFLKLLGFEPPEE